MNQSINQSNESSPMNASLLKYYSTTIQVNKVKSHFCIKDHYLHIISCHFKPDLSPVVTKPSNLM